MDRNRFIQCMKSNIELSDKERRRIIRRSVESQPWKLKCTIANSCSTMHKIAEKEFTLDDFSCEHLMGGYLEQMRRIIDDLNNARKYFTVGDQFFSPGNKRDWWQMIQLLPSSYNQTRNVMMNYEVLANIYKSRKDHKLDEWRNFCKWIEELPYSELIAGKTKEN